MSLLALAGATAISALLVTAAPPAATPAIRRVQHEYDLSTYEGPLEANWANVAYDPQHRELFLVAGESISVFKAGLKVFEFATEPEVGIAYAVAPLDNGDLLVASVAGVFRCNFRGRLLGRFEVKGAPPGYEDFRPNWIERSGGKLYLASGSTHRVLVVEEDGSFVAAYDLRALVFDNKVSPDQDLGGFGVDAEGNLLLTSPALAKAYIVSPDGKVRAFGTAGSRNGAFNTPGPIARDDRGILYVADTLRCVVILFDRELNFIGEIGGRGRHRGGLLPPASIAVGNDMLFVSQGAGRGVSAFRVVTH